MKHPARLLWLLLLLFVCGPAQASILAVLEISGAALPGEQRSALTDAIRQAAVDAAMGSSLLVMTQANMEVMLSDNGLDASCISEGACEVDTLRTLNADYGFTGKVVAFPDTLVVTVQLYETKGGNILGSKQVKSSDPIELLVTALPAATTELMHRIPGLGGVAVVAEPQAVMSNSPPPAESLGVEEPEPVEEPPPPLDPEVQEALDKYLELRVHTGYSIPGPNGRESLGRRAFYEYVGRYDLNRIVRRRYAFLCLSPAPFVGTLLYVRRNDVPDENWEVYVTGRTLTGIVTGSLMVAQFISATMFGPKTRTIMWRERDRFNRELREELGLPDDLSGYPGVTAAPRPRPRPQVGIAPMPVVVDHRVGPGLGLLVRF